MDSVRSETSEGSLASSRLDDGSATGRGSLSLSFSNSHTGRLSTDSISTRSDYLSTYERKFQERKAAKQKKSERIKRQKELADRQELVSADQRRRAQREAERLARRQEMETWLTDPNELRRLERRAQKRSRDRMRSLKEWYVPATSGPAEEVQPVFVAAMSHEQSNQKEPTSRKQRVELVLSKEAAAVKHEDEREALEAVLCRQLSALTTKLEYLEQFGDPVAVRPRAQTRTGPRRRRIARQDLHLTPLGPARSNLEAANVPTSTSLQTLRRVHVDDARDDAEVDHYLLRYRQTSKQNYAAGKLQATWRMHLRRRKYLPWRQRRSQQRRAVFEIWVMTYRVGDRAQRSLLRKYFSAWRADVVEALQLREMELQLFRQAATQTTLPRMVLNLVFTSDWEDERATRLAAKAAEAAIKKAITPASKAAFLTAFLHAAFGEIETVSSKKRSRVHQLRAQHVAAREEVRKKVVQHVFRLWKRVHEANKRVGLNAQLCLKRAVRMAFGAQQRWPAEILLSVFEIWARWTSFSRCKRFGLPMPRFAQTNPHWEIWLHNYQERQVRCVKAAAKAPAARLRRSFLRLHAFARRAVRARRALALASETYARAVRLNTLLAWRDAIAGSAADKKLVRGVVRRMHRYACAKRKLRPLKEVLGKRRREWLARRAIRGWERVQLHACFKREHTLSRLATSQTWRSRLQRTLDLWRDDRDARRRWRTFNAWTHFVRQRKFFLTLRLLCARQERRHLLFGVFSAWKAAKWERVDGFLEDRLRLDAWEAYRELCVFFPMMFYGSFSDAGSIFGGLPSFMYGETAGAPSRLKQEQQDLALATSGDAVRHFHGVLTRDSVVDVRNAILQTRYLVNAVDEATGNTALHVAAQIEEPERRLEIVALLLSEGAAMLKRVNRHGLAPVQLALDPPDTRQLLNEGLFAFHSRNILTQGVKTEGGYRLLWCMTTLMVQEWGTGQRRPADVRTGQWHSTLREELWLRQQCVRFAPDSTFAPAVSRSRGFLNALKTRLCLSRYDVLYASEVSRCATDERRYHEWEERTTTGKAKPSDTGEYEAYARYLLAATLDTAACEQELIPSFVGLLFSLEFSLQEIVSQAYRLEDECARAEDEVWELYQRIQRAEKAWSALFDHKLTPDECTAQRNNVQMLRLFTDDADVELFFEREVFLLDFAQFKAIEDRDGSTSQQEALERELVPLIIRTKRKLRRAEKKLKRVQEQIDMNERAHRQALFATGRRVDEICTARMALEHSRLRMAVALLKHNEVKAFVARLEYAKQVLQNGAGSCDPAVDLTLPSSVAALSFQERRTFYKTEMARYVSMFHTRVILEQTHTAAKTDDRLEPVHVPEALHLLQKEAVSKLHTLFVLNLLRSCCCWLADNMMAMETAYKTERVDDSESEVGDEYVPPADKHDSRAERQSLSVMKLVNATGTLLAEGIPRRRSSLKNTRRVLETYHQGSSSSNVIDTDNDAMTATYASSALLLFQEERSVAERADQEQLDSFKVHVVATSSERNPVTGQLEVPPDHVVNTEAIPTTARPEAARTVDVHRNRKKEELQRAMGHHRLGYTRGDSDSDSEDSNCSAPDDLVREIHGTDLQFGNFVTSDGNWSNESDKTIVSNEKEAFDAADTEAMWKRGNVKLADGSALSIKEVLAQAHRLSMSREKLRPTSRRQGLVLPEAPELPQPLQDVPEAQRRATVEPGRTSPTTEQQQPAVDRPLGRTVSISCLVERQEEEMASVSEDQAISTVIQAPNRQNSAGTGRTSIGEAASGANTSQLETFDHKTHEMDDVTEIRTTLNTSDEVYMDLQECKQVEIEMATPPLQSPVVEIGTSQISEASALFYHDKKIKDSVSCVNPLIKWEEATTFEAFPLVVTLRNSMSREKGEFVTRPRVIKTGINELIAPQFVLEDSTDNAAFVEVSSADTSDVFTLQGKSLIMATKLHRTRRKSSTTGTLETVSLSKGFHSQLDMKQDTQTTDEGSTLVRPITVTVVAKRAKREVEVIDVVDIKPVSTSFELCSPENLLVSPPKPFVKLEGDMEVKHEDVNASAMLQLRGMGLSSAVTSLLTENDEETLNLNVQKKPKQRKRRSPHRTTHQEDKSSLHADLALHGARIVGLKTDEPKSDGKLKENCTLEAVTPLSKTEKERLWQEFAAEPLSIHVQDAYALLYPQTYSTGAPTDVLTYQQVHEVPVSKTKSSRPKSLIHASLIVDATHQPFQKGLEHTRKFWSAVEGYRAIGTSSLVPLDAVTIAQRRQDKAQAIFDQFLRGERGTDSNDHALAWLDVYPTELAQVRAQLDDAPKGLFDELQRTAELEIAAALSKTTST